MTYTTTSFRGAKRRGNLLNGNTLSPLSMVGFEGIATSGDALLAMTYTHKRTQRCHSERSEESLGEC